MKTILVILAIAVAAGCATQRPLVGSDGRAYVLVKKVEHKIGVASDPELWQRVGETGDGKPFYTRRLQASSNTNPPVYTRVR